MFGQPVDLVAQFGCVLVALVLDRLLDSDLEPVKVRNHLFSGTRPALFPAGFGWETMLVLALVALAAGWVDAVVGGGGLLQLPALLLVPGIAPVQALATNKLASICGTTTSAVTYYRRVRPDLRTALPMVTTFPW